MSDERLGLHQEGYAYAGKMVLGTGVSVFGALTLNDWALLCGILCSVVITLQALLNIWWKWRDRQQKQVAPPQPLRTPQDE
jgi:hypothetical protein